MRDANMEMPADFWEKLNEWALESIGFISLDLRLGILNDQSASEQGKKLNAVSILLCSMLTLILIVHF